VRLHLGRPGHALIVAPHPDDETIGAAGLIRVLRLRGVRVTVVVVSDGAASHPGSRAWPRDRLIAGRRRESLRALHRLGVTAGAVTFLALPDGRIGQAARRGGRRLRAIVAGGGCDLIVGPASGDAHPDHRAVAAMLAGIAGPARRLAYQVWPARQRQRAQVRSLRIAGDTAMKRSLIRLYRTQTGAIRDDPAGFAIAAHELAAFAHPVERFVEVRR
jgi:LmbE family N-acetylglucosaminyl deacetylase